MCKYNNINGIIREIIHKYENVNGTIREVNTKWENVNGTIRQVFQNQICLIKNGVLQVSEAQFKSYMGGHNVNRYTISQTTGNSNFVRIDIIGERPPVAGVDYLITSIIPYNNKIIHITGNTTLYVDVSVYGKPYKTYTISNTGEIQYYGRPYSDWGDSTWKYIYTNQSVDYEQTYLAYLSIEKDAGQSGISISAQLKITYDIYGDLYIQS